MSELQDAPFVVAAAVPEAAPLRGLPDAPYVGAEPARRVGDMIRGNLQARGPAPKKATTFLEAMEAGLQVSVSGLLARGESPSMQPDPDAPWYNRAAGNVAQTLGDLPFMVGGAVLGGGAGAELGPGAAITGAAGAFAVPAGLRATLMDAYDKGEFATFGDFWNRASGIMWQTTKGWLTGAATAGAGMAAKAVLPAAAPVIAKIAAPTAAELATMVSVGSALEGHVPTAQDFMDAAIVLGGIKTAGSTAIRLRSIYSQTGKAPAEVLADAKVEPTIAKDLGVVTPTDFGGQLDAALKERGIEVSQGERSFASGQPGARVITLADMPEADFMAAHGSTVEDVKAHEFAHTFWAGATALPNFRDPMNAALKNELIDVSRQFRPYVWENHKAHASEANELLADGMAFWLKHPERRSEFPEVDKMMRSYDAGDLVRNFPDTQADPIPRAYKPLAAAERARQIVPGVKAAEVAQSPFADVPQAKGEPALPTHVNYNLLNTTEDASAALSRLSMVYEHEIQTQRRGTVSWEQTSQETAKMLADTVGGVDPALIMPREPGTTAGAAELLARKQLTIGAAEDMVRMAREFEAKGATATPEDALAFHASIERAALVQSQFLGARAEAGRALNILKSTARDAERIKQINDVLTMYGTDPASLAELAGRLGQMDSAAGALAFARDAVKATTYEKLVEAWKAGILSGPVTHVANIMGNTAFMLMRAPIDLVASGIGMVRTGADKVSPMEPIARLAGAVQGAVDGLRVAGHIVRTGEQPDIAKAEQFRKAIGGDVDSTPAARVAGDIVRLPFRFLSAEDAVFKTMNSRGELNTLAVRQAAEEGFSPVTREFRERVASLVLNPTEKMQKAAAEAADRFTFNTELGEQGKALQAFVRAWHLEFIVPFIRTPINIVKELARLTPLAPALSNWREDFAAGGARRDKAIAEFATGSASMAVVFMYALDGNISGAGEPDAGKRRVAQAAGWQPYSVKIGDTWYSYNRLQPIGTLMGMAADVAEVWDHLNDEEADQIPKMLAVAFANAVTNQTFLQGITNIVEAMADPKRFGPQLMQGFARSAVPNIVGQITEMNDPLARQVNGMLDAVKSRVPGLRDELLAKRDVFGEPIPTKERLGGVSPVQVSTESQDKVRSEAARLGVSAGDAPKKTHVGRGSGKIGDVELTPEQRDVFADKSGHLAHDVLTQIVNTPDWDRMPDLLKKRAFAKVFMQAHRAGAAAALPPQLRASIAEEITQKIEAELSPEE